MSDHEPPSDFLEALSSDLFGASRADCISANICVSCGLPALCSTPLSRREYEISGLCETCQSDFFDETP